MEQSPCRENKSRPSEIVDKLEEGVQMLFFYPTKP